VLRQLAGHSELSLTPNRLDPAHDDETGPNHAGAPRGRSYLKSQKYLEYRARPRRDTGKDGEPVWSDELEDALQQGN
jgi:hypothetical protein